MRRCPFADLAATQGRVVCGLHRGLVDGALEQLGTPLRVSELVPFAAPGRCLLRLG
jgi:predicted ArsR family transcriptional regulator